MRCRIFGVIAALVMGLTSFSSFAAEYKKVIRVGYFDFPGYHDTDTNGNRSGYGYEYLHEMSKTAGWVFQYIDESWDECQKMLENGEIDILTSAQYTPQRGEKFDFSSYPMGTSYAQLAVKSTNNKYTRNNFVVMNGITIGLLNGNSRNALLEQFAQEENFNYKSIYFDNLDDLENALQNNRVDAILTSSLRKLYNEKIIAQFAPSLFYCIVKKGNTELLSQIDNALETIEIHNPTLKFELYNKYYRSDTTNTFVPSNEEREYLNKNKVLKVVGDSSTKPIFYYENGVPRGIAYEIMEIIAEDLGVDIEYIQTDSFSEAKEMVRNGQADINCTFETDYSWAEQNHVKITSSYMSMYYSAITNGSGGEVFKTIALVDGLVMNELYVKSKYPNAKYTTYKSSEDAIKAVDNKKADVAFVNTYTAEIILDSKYFNLKSAFIGDTYCNLSLAVSDMADPVLYSILDNKINSLDEKKVSNIVSKNTVFTDFKLTPLGLVRKYPIQVVVSISFIAFLAVVIMAYISKNNKKHAEKVFDLAYNDKATGLWNINGFEKKGTEIINKNPDGKFAMVALDLAHFSAVNDNYGRKIGNKVISAMAQALARYINETTILAHVKADHFIMLMEFKDEVELKITVNNISVLLSSFMLSDLALKFKVNIGAYIVENVAGDNITVYIDRTEIAHRETKKQADHKVTYFDLAMKEILANERDIVDRVDYAIKNHEFVVYFQPKYNMVNGAIIGAEALVRWQHGIKGLINPMDFIPILENNGQIIDVDFYVLEQVCKLLNDRAKKKKKMVSISVNQSRVHFVQTGYMQRLQDLIVKYDIPDDAIELEITESLFNEIPNEIIKAIKKLGFLVSVDDFGSGYSSLQLLNQVSIDILKIDKSLLNNSETENKVQIIMRKVVEMATELGLDVICEGVETLAQTEFLMGIGCAYAQGYFYNKPMPIEQFLELLDSIE